MPVLIQAASTMPRLFVQNFGPLRRCELDVKGLLVFIGEQSSGKSTIARLLYFFRTVPDLLGDNMRSMAEKGNSWENLIKLLRESLMKCFGTTKHMPDFELFYQYAPEISIRVTREKKSGHARIEMSPKLRRELTEHMNAVQAAVSLEGSEGIRDPFRRVPPAQGAELLADVRSFFQQQENAIFIPAGRSVLSTISGALASIDSYDFDPLMKSFVQQILILRRNFSQTMEEQLDLTLRAKLRDAPVRREHIKLAIQLIHSILKGEYSYEQGRERIRFSKDEYVFLKFASSGQQEALWILLTLFSVVLNNTPVFMFIEEPEAHLFPKAQHDMVNLLALCKNFTPEPPSAHNHIVLTTHSPYILSSLNNLLYAWQVGSNGRREKVGQIVNPWLWLDPRDVGVWFVENGGIRSILDEELQLIRAEEIDGASSLINQTFDALAEVVEGPDRAPQGPRPRAHPERRGKAAQAAGKKGALPLSGAEDGGDPVVDVG